MNVGPLWLDTSSLPTTLSSDEPLAPGRAGRFGGSSELKAWRYAWQPGGAFEALCGEAGADPGILECLSRPAKSLIVGEPITAADILRRRALGYWQDVGRLRSRQERIDYRLQKSGRCSNCCGLTFVGCLAEQALATPTTLGPPAHPPTPTRAPGSGSK